MEDNFIFWSEIGIVIVVILIGILGGTLCFVLYKNKKAQNEIKDSSLDLVKRVKTVHSSVVHVSEKIQVTCGVATTLKK